MQNIALITVTLQGGGAERCAADLSLLFTKRGFRVFTFTDLSVNAEYEYAGTLVNYSFNLPVMNKGQEENPLRYKVNELKRLKDEYSIDIAISFLQWANYLNILSRGEEKVILTTHSVNSEYAKKYENITFWSDETFQDLYQYADLVTFPSEYCRKDWIEHYGDKYGITKTVYNPVHMMKVCEEGNKDNIVIAIGRMEDVKRQWHLIKAFRLVKNMCPDSRMIILGDGQLRPKLKEIVDQLGLSDDVEMPGNIKNVQDYLSKAKVFAMTSRCEAMPCSVLEALSAGVPVVSCDSPGGIREELGISYEQKDITIPLIGECGIITPYICENGMREFSHEEEIFADEIVHLFKDNDLRDKLAAAAVKRVQIFSDDAVGEIWINDIFNRNPDRKTDWEEFEKLVEKNINSYQNADKTMNMKMYVLYYRLLEKWMALHEKRHSAKEYFISREMKNIIIYGMGKMANHLIEDIKGSGINIICAIDMKAINKYCDFPVITVDETIPDADCIVITPIYECETIRQVLEDRTSVPLISLSDVIDECSMQRN